MKILEINSERGKMPDKNLRIDENDHAWLKANRGSEPMKALVSKVIAKYKESDKK